MSDQIKFRSRILAALRDLTKDNVQEIKFLLTGQIGEGILENIKSSLDLYQELEKLGWISSNGSLDLVIELMRGVSRDDIAQKLQCDKGHQDILPSVIFKGNNPIQTNEPVDRRLIDLVANEISNDWKRLGRFLDISESKLEGIDSDNHKLYEKSVQMFNEWTRCYSNATSSRLDVLKNALSEIPRYDIIRHIDSNYRILLRPLA